MNKRCLLFAVVVVLGCCQHGYSKGSPDKIIIEGGGRPHKIEITDRAALKGFDPWSGQFIEWRGGVPANPPVADATYDVSFYIKWKPRDRHLRFFYVFKYVAGRNGKRGLVYLPGRADRWGSRNAGTILRDGDDGLWHYASPAWDKLMRQVILLDRATQSASGLF
ncbi:MAG TPA: hypothetical protein VN937_04085 [Blastocatellia bacterium]|nr:hypothetical protein [Blastocatellia bacterium]